MDLRPPEPPLGDQRAGVALRPWQPEDAPALVAAWADPEIVANCSVPDDAGPERAATWIGGWEQRAVSGISLDLVVAGATRLPGIVLGEVGCWPFPGSPNGAVLELGWWIGAPHRGCGRATAAVRLLADWALAGHRAGALAARIQPGHRPSEAVAAHAGFRRGRTLPTGDVLWARSAATVHP